MCLITSMLRKQGLIVIWGRAHAAAPAHWWILMMSVFLTVCYTNTGLGGGRGWARGRGGGGGGASLVNRILPRLENCKARFSHSKLFHDAAIPLPRGNTFVTTTPAAPADTVDTALSLRRFPSLSSIHLFTHASLGYLITHLLPGDAAIVAVPTIIGKSLQNLHWFAFKTQALIWYLVQEGDFKRSIKSFQKRCFSFF